MISWQAIAIVIAVGLIAFSAFTWMAAGMSSASNSSGRNWPFFIGLLLLVLALAGCNGKLPPPETIHVPVEVKVPTPVPCPALAKLGPEPEYADSDAAIAKAPDVFETARLYAKGRLQRIQRLAMYGAAWTACTF